MRTMLIDLGSVYWTCFFGSTDNASEAQNRTLRIVRDALHAHDVVAVCIDSPKSWRRDAYAGYKAQREPKPAGAVALLEDTIERIRKECHVLGADGYEADDVLATAARWLVDQRDRHPRILSADKDLLQCLDDATCIVKPDGAEVTAAELEAKRGLTPAQVPLWLALMGDTSDNVPGVDKVGDKTARKLAGTYGTIDGIANAIQAGAIKGAVADSLTAAIHAPSDENLDLWLRLTTLSRDAPIACSVLDIPTTPKEDPMNYTGDRDDDRPSEPDPEPPPAPSSDPGEPLPPPASETRAMVVTSAAEVDVRSSEPFERQLEPRTMKAAMWLAFQLHKSQMFAVKSPEAALTVLLCGRDLGMSAVAALRNIHIVKGRPVLSAQLMMALCMRHPDCEHFYEVESSTESVTYETMRRGNPKPTRCTWTLEDAKRARLLDKGGDSNWSTYPRMMLRARCISELAKTVYPDAVSNVYVEGELEGAA